MKDTKHKQTRMKAALIVLALLAAFSTLPPPAAAACDALGTTCITIAGGGCNGSHCTYEINGTHHGTVNTSGFIQVDDGNSDSCTSLGTICNTQVLGENPGPTTPYCVTGWTHSLTGFVAGTNGNCGPLLGLIP